MKRLFLLLLIVTTTLASTDQRVVYVIGDATIIAPAPEVTMNLCIETQNDLLKNALSENSNSRKHVVSELIASGISKDQIKSSGGSTIPQIRYFSPKTKSYLIRKDLVVTIKNDIELLRVAAIVDSIPELTFISSSYEVANADSAENAVMVKAVKAAKERIGFLEKESGMTYAVTAIYPDILPENVQVAPTAPAVFDRDIHQRYLFEVGETSVNGYNRNSSHAGGGQKSFSKRVYLECVVSKPQ